MRILVVEDEPRLSETLRDILENQQYLVDTAATGPEGLDCSLSGIYDAILLDVMLPKLDGWSVAKALRSEGCTTPILMLTAKSGLEDRVRGLDCGADYYLAKPFDSRELLACLRVLLRRNSGIQPQLLSCGNTSLDLSACTLGTAAKQLRLTAREFELMRLLMANHPSVVSKETLLLKVWGYDSDAEDNNVEVYISFLRKKLRHIGSTLQITALRRVGYYLEVRE